MTATSTIDRSYQVLALLDICEHVARDMGMSRPGDDAPRLLGNLANVIALAGELAEEVHDAMESGEVSHHGKPRGVQP